MSQRRPIRAQFESNINLKIVEKPLFFLGFFNISRKFVETCGNALGSVREGLGSALGTPWRAFGEAGDALGGPSGRPGTPWKVLGTPKRALLGEPSWETLGNALESLSGRPNKSRQN